jgi:hypothetical protein
MSVLMMSILVVMALVFLIIGNVMAGTTAQMVATKLIVVLTQSLYGQQL